MANGGDDSFSHLLGAAVLLVGQLVGGVIWLTRLGARVKTIEDERKLEREERNAERLRIDAELRRIDSDGTRALGVLKVEQIEASRRIDKLERLREKSRGIENSAG